MKRRPAQTLVEVTVATLIAAITTTAVFSVFLSSFYSTSKADNRDAAAMVLRRAQDTLKSYVSVDPLNVNMINGLPGSPVNPQTGLAGRWPADSSGNWALATGNHDITSLLAGTPLVGGTFTYTVALLNNCLGITPINVNDFNVCKTVTFNLSYPDK
jgi:type II secretory pathway pseudopilin PulG